MNVRDQLDILLPIPDAKVLSQSTVYKVDGNYNVGAEPEAQLSLLLNSLKEDDSSRLSKKQIEALAAHRLACDSTARLLDVDMERLQLEVNRLIAKMQILDARRQDLRRVSTFLEGITTSPASTPPINRLPYEILSQIFTLCSHDEDLLNTQNPPLLISKVCSYWRQTVLSIPRLWSNLHIRLPFPTSLGFVTSQLPCLAETWYSRAGTRSLSFALMDERHGNLSDEATLVATIAVSPTITPRISDLRLCVSEIKMLGAILTLPKGLFSSLENLTLLVVIDYAEGMLKEPITAFEDAPSLRSAHLQLNHMYLMDKFPWGQLVRLEYSDRLLHADWDRMFRRLGNLQWGSFHIQIDSDYEIPSTTLLYPSLQFLKLETMGRRMAASSLLDSFEMPALQTYVTSGNQLYLSSSTLASSLTTLVLMNFDPKQGLPYLLSFFQGGCETLERLAIDCRGPPNVELWPTLAARLPLQSLGTQLRELALGMKIRWLDDVRPFGDAFVEVARAWASGVGVEAAVQIGGRRLWLVCHQGFEYKIQALFEAVDDLVETCERVCVVDERDGGLGHEDQGRVVGVRKKVISVEASGGIDVQLGWAI